MSVNKHTMEGMQARSDFGSSNIILCRQLVVCSIASMSDILTGLTTGAPTVIIPQLRRETNSSGTITDEMVSWASSASNLAGLFWVPILLTMAHLFGRKTTVLILNVFQFLAFLNFYYSADITMVIVNQALLGINNAGMKTLFIMVISEFANLKYRGLFLTFNAAGFLWGIWISNTLGTFLHWTSIGLFGMISSGYIFLALCMIPESPFWLARKGKYEACASSHRWLKGVDNDTEKELSRMIANCIENREVIATTGCGSVSCRHLKLILKPEMYKPIFCCILLQMICDFSCKLVLSVYAIDILKEITGDEQMAYTGMLILDGATVSAMYLASALIKIINRKKLLLLASLLTIFLLSLLSCYLFLVRYAVVAENIYVTMTILIIYSISVSCPIIAASVIQGEILPFSSSFWITVTATILIVIKGSVLKVSFYIFKYLGNHGAFLVHVAGFTTVFFLAYKNVPETKNKTLHEIYEFFKRPVALNAEDSKCQADVLIKEGKPSKPRGNMEML